VKSKEYDELSAKYVHKISECSYLRGLAEGCAITLRGALSDVGASSRSDVEHCIEVLSEAAGGKGSKPADVFHLRSSSGTLTAECSTGRIVSRDTKDSEYADVVGVDVGEYLSTYDYRSIRAGDCLDILDFRLVGEDGSVTEPEWDYRLDACLDLLLEAGSVMYVRDAYECFDEDYADVEVYEGGDWKPAPFSDCPDGLPLRYLLSIFRAKEDV